MIVFAANSRYAAVEIATMTLPDGREVNFVRRRFLPLPESLVAIGTYTVKADERLDNIAAKVLGDPELFWRIGDGNRALSPDALEATGTVLRITLPAGMPGVPGA